MPDDISRSAWRGTLLLCAVCALAFVLLVAWRG